MARRPLHGGFIVAVGWILLNIVLWAVVAYASVFLSALLVLLCMAALTITPTT